MIKPFYQIHLKLLAVLAAFTLWFVVITVENTVYRFPEPVEVKAVNLGKNMSLESALPAVQVYLRADKEDMQKITKNDLEIYLDLSDTGAGERTVPVSALSKSPLAQVLKTDPEEIRIKISPVIEKEVEVKITVEGSPRKGYKTGATEMLSEKVTVSGAQSVVDRVEYIEAKIILDGTQTENLKQSVQLSLPASLNISPQLITLNPSETVVEVEILSETAEKEVRIVPRFNSENDKVLYGDKIEISPATVKVTGDGEVIEKMESVDTIFIEMGAVIRNGKIAIGLDLPEGVSLSEEGQVINVIYTGPDINDGPTI